MFIVGVSTCSCDSDSRFTDVSPSDETRKQTLPSSNWMDSSNWEVVSEYMFEDHGKVLFEHDQIILRGGDPATGIRYLGETARDFYQVTFEAKRVTGNDFFCGMTFPVGQQYCTLILGGWSGTIVGLSNVDDEPAVENITANTFDFKNDRWYTIRLEVADSLGVWIDDRKVVELKRGTHRFSLWWEQEEMVPFGIATWGNTTGAVRNLRFTASGR